MFNRRPVLILSLFPCFLHHHGLVSAFTIAKSYGVQQIRRSSTELSILDKTSVLESTLLIKERLSEFVVSTDRGRSNKQNDEENVEKLLKELESYNTLVEPTRNPLTGGSWTVGYTTAPPPSNGQLGPFKGIAQQIIDMNDKTYKNVLIVPPNEWLKASLDAVWEEWDGVIIDDDAESIAKWRGKKEDSDKNENTVENVVGDQNEVTPSNFLFDNIVALFTGKLSTDNVDDVDYGANCWRVTFKSLTFFLLGKPIFTKKFDDGVQRIWRTTYLDQETRIVRAGRTGLPEDEIAFYMTRTD